jgi:hypothetical protein
MRSHLMRRIPLPVRAPLVLAVLALGYLAVVGVGSLAGTASADPAAPNPGHLWTELENHGTTGSGDYWLGTTTNKALELDVNGARALRLEPNPTSPNVIGGYSGNSVTGGAYGATIGGGGAGGGVNEVTRNYGTVGGGVSNSASGDGTFVGGGYLNTASGGYATVGGGQSNSASNMQATVGGGYSNSASGWYTTVGGGWTNTASGAVATVGGGWANLANNQYATVGGGRGNQATNQYATVGGGQTNSASLPWATVGGGYNNTASMSYATVGGGSSNTASGAYGTVGGGQSNTVSSMYATVPGGWYNTAQGYYSFAAGQHANADKPGCFVWGDDSASADITCGVDNAFKARASGGYWLYSNSALTTGSYLAPGTSSWSSESSRDLKENFTPVDGQEVLARVAEIPMSTWNYKAEDASIRHMGPMAQDFYAAFGLGESDTAITTVDADGVALAAIQGLYQLSQEQAARIDALEKENASLQQRLDGLEARVSALEGNGTNVAVSQASSGLPTVWLVLAGGLALALGGLLAVQRRVSGGGR